MAAPVNVEQVFNLLTAEGGINPASISFKNVTMESSKYICVRDQAEAGSSIVIVDLPTKSTSRHKISADAAIMNPVSKVLALKAEQTLQIFNLDMKTRMKTFQMTDTIVFWRWISTNTIAMVTPTSVFHWSMEGTSDPVKVFDRAPELQSAQILNYRTDPNLTWLMVIGVEKQADNTLKGITQLYSVEKGASKVIEGHAATCLTYKHNGQDCTVLAVASNSAAGGKLFIMEVPSGTKQEVTFERKVVPISFNGGDFPVAVQASTRHALLYIVTRGGILYLYDVPTGTSIYQGQVAQQPIFVTTVNDDTSGLIGVTTAGTVLSIAINDAAIVSYIQQQLNNYELAVNIAARANLGGADELFTQKFDNLLREMNITEAVKLAAEAPRGLLRTPQTIQKLQSLPQLPGQPPALSVYFKALLEKGKLNATESLELAKIVMQKPGGAEYIKKLMDEDKVTESEDLGQLLQSADADLALKIFFKCGAHVKVLNILLQRGDFSKVTAYCTRVNYQPEWPQLLQNMMNVNPDGSAQFAAQLHEMEGGPKMDPNRVVDLFLQRNLIKQVTAYLLEILKENKQEDAALQTRLLEINLMYSPPNVADQILGQCGFSHYDKLKIAQLCEKAQLYQRALENYAKVAEEHQDGSVSHHIKRVIVNTHALNPEWLVEFFGNFSKEDSLASLRELMTHNPRQNFKVCVQIATKYAEELGPQNLIDLFLSFNSYEALYYFLGSIVNFSKDPEVHFRYIEAATRVGQYSEVERVTRESTVYEPERTKNFLKEARLADLWPLINVCDQHNYIEELVRYLHDTQNIKYVENYVQKRNPMKAPYVVGALLDCDVGEDYVKNLILSLGPMCPVEPLIEETEKRNRLKLISGWLEARAAEGNQEPVLHNALGKIYIDSNQNAEQFLRKNQFYDSRIVGKYCENRDPTLALIAYERGVCDNELVDLTNKNGMYKQQARYLVHRQNPELWATVLTEENEHRKPVVDQVVQTALPETTVPEEVSSTVKAFMAAEMPHELTELLEKIVLHGSSEFRNNKFLQNLLILTAIKADQTRVMDYVNRLDNYDALDIATIAENAGLFEEAFAVYKKFNHNSQAIRVLLESTIDSVERAVEFAERVSEPEVWSVLGRAQLKKELVPEAIESFLKAKDATQFNDVIQAAEAKDAYTDLVRYLQMARQESKHKESTIDTELIYAFAKTKRLAELEEFIGTPNVAQVQYIADRCFNEELYEAARILFQSINNYARLAVTLVRMKEYYPAVEAAGKANSIKTWKEVLAACVEVGEFRLAQMCATQIMVQADELEDLIRFYEERGHFEELMSVIKSGLGLDRAHMGMFTELGVLYAKYKPDKLMEHIKLFHKRINAHKLIRTCERFYHWSAARFLYTHSDEHDNAVKLMMQHPADAWEHEVFKDALTRVSGTDLCYQAMHFYIDFEPTRVVDLLNAVSKRLDNERIVTELKRVKQLPLGKPYLEGIADANLKGVNDALNDLYIEEGDYESLRKSIEKHQNFDQIGLADRLRKHELVEFRRVAAALYKQNKKWKQSVELSKQDKMYRDAIDTVAESEDKELAEELVRYFVDNKLYECFSASLFACYDLLPPDVVLELGWRHKQFDFIMPFMIQNMKEMNDKVNSLQGKIDQLQGKGAQGAQGQAGGMGGMGGGMGMLVPVGMSGGGMGGHGMPAHGGYGMGGGW